MHCPTLPDIVTLDKFNGNFIEYQNFLYDLYRKEIKQGLTYNGIKITMRSHPRYLEKEESFYHFTCKEWNKDGERAPDLRRCERLCWIKPTIMTNHPIVCGFNCLKIYKKGNRLHLLNDKDRFLIVLEVRRNYILLVTSFYIEYDHTLAKKIKDYERYKV